MLRKLFSVLFLALATAKDHDYAAFVVDDTASMSNEIRAVKQWITSCMRGNKDTNKLCESTDQFILATFNDPTTGKVIGPGSNETIYEELQKIKPHGGGNCSESVYEGIENAVSVIPFENNIGRCNIFVFSDGTPNNIQRGHEIYASAIRKGCTIPTILSGCCGECHPGCDSPNKKYCINRLNLEVEQYEISQTKEATTTPPPTVAPKDTDRYVAFIVDDTGSMWNEIEAVKLWIETCVKGSTEKYGVSPCIGVNKFVLATYNDPTVGIPVGPTDQNTILEAVKKIRANGGGDCPEKLYSGVIAGLSVIPPKPQGPRVINRCKVFIFTDATAKKDSKALEAFKAAMAKGCTIDPLLTGCCGPCPSPCTATGPYCRNNGVIYKVPPEGKARNKRALETPLSSSELLYSLAESTGGKIFLIEKPSKPEDMLEFLEENGPSSQSAFL